MDNSNIGLSKEADYLICALYRAYTEQRADGAAKSQAKCFGSSAEIRDAFMPEALYEDVDETCKELSRNGMLNCVESDFEVLRAELTDESIVYMENRYKNKIKSIVKHMLELAPIIFR